MALTTISLVVAVVSGSIAVVDSNQRPVLVADELPGTGTTAGPSQTEPWPPRMLAAAAVLVPAAKMPTSQGVAGVIPVPLAPMAVAGPIPLLAWRAYHRAAAGAGCGLPWYLLAGIGKIESDHGRFHGARFDVTGTVHPAILGPGTVYGRAMGPMQFIPPTWTSYAADGNKDHRTDPQNVFDATKAAARYLCVAGGADLSHPKSQRRAVFAYNHLASYVRDVLAFAAAYRHGRPESSVHLVPITYPASAVKKHHKRHRRPTGATPTHGPSPTAARTSTAVPSASGRTTAAPCSTARASTSAAPSATASPSGTASLTGTASATASPSGTPTSGTPTTGTPTTGTPTITPSGSATSGSASCAPTSTSGSAAGDSRPTATARSTATP